MAELITQSLKYREEYDAGIKIIIANRQAECDKLRSEKYSPEKISANREEIRKEFTDLLGWPLNCYEKYRSSPMAVKKTPQGENKFAKIWRMQFEVLPELWFYGLFFESKKDVDLPFVICQHGGLGTPETASGIVGNTSNYNHMTERAYQYKSGAHAFAPGLYLWRDDTAGPVHDRAQADIALKQLGGSIAALEVFAIRRVLDYFEKEGFARDGHIGMIGLSYGGSYAVLTAAADTRITAVYSSCQFNNRYIYNRADWVWRNSASSFLDAEIASLIAPRALFLEEGTSDDLFRADTFIAECERTVLFFEAAGASDKLKFRTFEGGHELCKDSAGYDFLFKYI